MSYKVPLTTIKEIKSHPGADRLEIAVVYGFDVVVQKGQYKQSDPVVYIPIDSILPQALEDAIFPPDSKVKLHKHRIRQIMLRGYASQGMLLSVDTIQKYIGLSNFKLEEDLSGLLGITKYEPPAPDFSANMPKIKKGRNRQYENPYFHKYGGLDNYKWYPDLFQTGEIVTVSEKNHGTSFRCGYVPYNANSKLKKILKFLHLVPSHQFVWGSNNVQLQSKEYKGFYEENIYGRMVKQYNLKKVLQYGEVIYGEIIGPGIQNNYHYGIERGQYRMLIFDLKIQTITTSEYVDFEYLKSWCRQRNLGHVVELYNGPFDFVKIKALTIGNSVYCPEQKVIEGVVIKPVKETVCSMGRKVLKLISEDYLDNKTNTDNH